MRNNAGNESRGCARPCDTAPNAPVMLPSDIAKATAPSPDGRHKKQQFYKPLKFKTMGKIKQGILGGFSGKVGPVIGTSWKGKAVMRAQALSYNDRNSLAQQQQRKKFTLVTKFVASVLGFVNEGFRKRAVGMTAPNAAVAANIENAISGEWPDFEIDYSKAVVANGPVDLPYSPSATADGTTLSLTWADNSGMGNALADDKVMVLAYNEAKGQAVYNTAVAERADRNATLTLPSAWTGDNVNVWIAMSRQQDNESSRSSHLATLPL